MALNVTPDTLREYSRIPDSSKFPSAVVFNETAIAADGKIVFRTIDKSYKSIGGNDLSSLALDGKGGLYIGAWDKLFAIQTSSLIAMGGWPMKGARYVPGGQCLCGPALRITLDSVEINGVVGSCDPIPER